MFIIYVNRKSCPDREAYYRFPPTGVQHLDAVMRASSDSIAGKQALINYYRLASFWSYEVILLTNLTYFLCLELIPTTN